VFRLIGFLFMFALTAGGYLYFDYKMAARWAGKEDAEGLTFPEYLSGLSGRLANLGGAASAAGLPSKLADMLPTPPAGWTLRPVEAKDVDGFLPKGGKKTDPAGIAAVKAMAEGEKGSGVEVAAMTYEKGDRKLIIKAVRYPNLIFTSMAAMDQRLELQTMSAQFRGTEFATVRGLDLTEDLLPDGVRGRMFLANVGAQIHLRILAPKRMKDADLLPFLETLHVKAMNADVIDKVPGLGDVPVIVLASALEGDARDAYLADVASRSADAAAKEAAAQVEAAAAAAAKAPAPEAAAEPAAAGGGFFSQFFGSSDAAKPDEAAPAEAEKSISCTTGKDGVKRCQIKSAAPDSN
jgi:hypothetical protein